MSRELDEAVEAWSREGRDIMWNKHGWDLTAQDRYARWLRERAEAAQEAEAKSLLEALTDEQAKRCAYGTREGDGRTCDCKYGGPQPGHGERTGCPELRRAIWVLRTGL